MESSGLQNTKIIPIPVAAPDGTYAYVAVKGSLHAPDSAIFGLSKEEEGALQRKFDSASTNRIVGGVLVKGHPIQVINALGQLGYKVVCSTGETEVVWTMQREI